MKGLQWLTRLPGQFVVLGVRCYQFIIRPWLGQSCRFVPSCSEYMIEAVQKYGAIRGVWKGICRIGRCNPFHPGGWDPP